MATNFVLMLFDSIFRNIRHLKKIPMAIEERRQTQLAQTSTTTTGTASSQTSGIPARLVALVSAMRLRQWTKNLALFVGLVFAQRLFILSAFERAAVAFVAFCLASSIIYLLNDLLDLENDRQHPAKRHRPLASGRLPVSWAVVSMGILLLACAGLTSLIFTLPVETDTFARFGGANLLFAATIFSYLLLMVLYSIRLKHIVLLDVFVIASG